MGSRVTEALLQTARSRKSVPLAAAAILVAVTVFAAVVGSTPASCGRCHGRFTAVSGSHRDVGCYACHLEQGRWGLVAQKGDEFLRMYPMRLLSRGPSGPTKRTAARACLACHSEVLEHLVVAGGHRIQHAACASGTSCDPCHSTVAHGSAIRWKTRPVMEQCVSCHKTRNVSIACDTCHTNEARRDGRTQGPWQVTHGKNWRVMHGMGDLQTCVTCHAEDFCKKCHGIALPHPATFGASHGETALKDRSACTTCHESAGFCTACHGGFQMPHPAGFLKTHARSAKSKNDPACVRCHEASDCTTCHGYHIHPGGSKGVPVPWTRTVDTTS